MFTYQLIQTPSFKIDNHIVDNIFESISKNIDKEQKWILNIVFVSLEEIQELNANYRQKNKATDVLSFHYYEDFSQLEETDIAGELVFCEEKILSQWEEYGLGEEKEFYKLLIHSLLHILWYDHENDDEHQVMKKWEEKIWDELFSS